MILHLVTKVEWDAKPADQPYMPDAFAKDGFIHCTQGDALMLDVANHFYKATPGHFLVVGIDETKVTSPIKWEAPADSAITASASPTPATPNTSEAKPADVPPEVQAEVGAQASTLPVAAVPAPPDNAPAAAPATPGNTPTPVRFPHIYGPLNRDAIMGVRRVLRADDGTFNGFAPLEDAPQGAQTQSEQTRLKTPSELANELVDTTGDFSDALARYKDKIEARMDELDKNIKDL